VKLIPLSPISGRRNATCGPRHWPAVAISAVAARAESADRKATPWLKKATTMLIRLTLYSILTLSSMVFGLTADLVYSGVLVM
jgi:hypothetical protein